MNNIDLQSIVAARENLKLMLAPIAAQARQMSVYLNCMSPEQLLAANEDFERRCAEQDAQLRAREEERERRKLSSRIKRGVIIALSPVLVGLAWLFVLVTPTPKKAADAGAD